jgi:hypothetical protein
MATCHPRRPVKGLGLCKRCYGAKNRRDRLANPLTEQQLRERERGWKREWMKRNRDAVNRRKRAKRYGLTPEEVVEILSRGCEICGGKNHLHIDHDHRTGVARGCLCPSCNTFVGHLEKSDERTEKAIEYLRRSRA